MSHNVRFIYIPPLLSAPLSPLPLCVWSSHSLLFLSSSLFSELVSLPILILPLLMLFSKPISHATFDQLIPHLTWRIFRRVYRTRDSALNSAFVVLWPFSSMWSRALQAGWSRGEKGKEKRESSIQHVSISWEILSWWVHCMLPFSFHFFLLPLLLKYIFFFFTHLFLYLLLFFRLPTLRPSSSFSPI